MKARGRDAEVRDERVAVLVEQDVVRLHIAVHDAVPVRVVERDRDLRAHARCDLGGTCHRARMRSASEPPAMYGITRNTVVSSSP